ncbi:hypothetical protein Dimus_029349 [Dionaea muscipula]
MVTGGCWLGSTPREGKPRRASDWRAPRHPQVRAMLARATLKSTAAAQDSANCNGGKWIIRLKKVVSRRFWEDLVDDMLAVDPVLALVGDQHDYGDDVCGAVLSIRFDEDILERLEPQCF